jgi:hypothetical protein
MQPDVSAAAPNPPIRVPEPASPVPASRPPARPPTRPPPARCPVNGLTAPVAFPLKNMAPVRRPLQSPPPVPHPRSAFDQPEKLPKPLLPSLIDRFPNFPPRPLSVRRRRTRKLPGEPAELTCCGSRFASQGCASAAASNTSLPRRCGPGEFRSLVRFAKGKRSAFLCFLVLPAGRLRACIDHLVVDAADCVH